MKVNIGPYKDWIGPFQIAEMLCFWAKPVVDKYGFKSKPDWVHDFGTWLSGGKDGESTLYKVCQWVEKHRHRKIKVKIDRWDTWGMDHTLGVIALPMLQQLKATKHGAPFVDDEDVPEELKSTSAPAKANEWDTDENHFRRWDWVMDEMIFAFEHHLDKEWEDAYRTGKSDFKSVACEWDENGKAKMYQLVKGPDHTLEYDWDGMKLVHARIQNGFRLFGKYYSSLWD